MFQLLQERRRAMAYNTSISTSRRRNTKFAVWRLVNLLLSWVRK
jgi:hypothetical protein